MGMFLMLALWGTTVSAAGSNPTIENVQVVESNGTYTITANVSASSGISKVQFPTWTSANGQDDITWGTGTVSNGVVTYTVDFADHNYETGTYYTHIYVYDKSGNYTMKTLAVSMEYSAPTVDVKVSESAGKYTVTVTIEDSYDISKVMFPTWTSANGQDDLKWYTGTVSNGKATYTIDFANHNYETGTYYTHVYVYDKTGNYTCAPITASVVNDAPTIGTATVTKSSGEYTISVPVSDDYGITKVMLPTWTSANGQDDIKWYTATVSNGVATYTVDFANHNYETGTYYTHIYVYDKAGTYTVKALTVTMSYSEPTLDVSVSNGDGKYTVTVEIEDSYDVSKVMLPTWTSANGQDDIKWYTGTASNGTITYTIDFANHNYETGTYYTHVYVYDKLGNYTLKPLTITVSNAAPTVGTATVTKSDGKYTVSVPVSDGYGISKVLMPTWTSANGQDDIKWYTATVSNGVATYTIDFKNHNYETGTYYTHIYTYDNAGKYTVKYVTVTMANEAPTIGTATVTNSDGKYTISVPVSDSYGISKVLMPTWTSANGQDDIKWYTATVSNGVATYTVDFKNHNYETGTYYTHIYVYDNAGKYTTKSVTVTVTNAAPTISNVTISSVTTQGYTITCNVSDSYGISKVYFPTWTTSDGQDDIVWGVGTVSNGVATYTVKVSDHNYEYGDYVTHVYAYDNAGVSTCAVAGTTTLSTGVTSSGWFYLNGVKFLNDTSGTLVDGAALEVIDVSKWQGTVEWTTVFTKSSVDAVILRSSYGFTVEDTQFDTNVAALEKLGVDYGVYHYCTATTTSEAIEQANFAVSVMKAAGASPDLPVYVDIEENGGSVDLVAIAVAFCNVLEANGYDAGIYANYTYWENYLNSSSLDKYDKWIARYGTNNGYAMSGWRPDDEYSLWQYTSVGTVSGMSGNIDMNVMFR